MGGGWRYAHPPLPITDDTCKRRHTSQLLETIKQSCNSYNMLTLRRRFGLVCLGVDRYAYVIGIVGVLELLSHFAILRQVKLSGSLPKRRIPELNCICLKMYQTHLYYISHHDSGDIV